MKNKMIGVLINLLVQTLDADLLKQFTDTALDFIEKKVLGTASTIDDAIVLPLVKSIREAFNLPE